VKAAKPSALALLPKSLPEASYEDCLAPCVLNNAKR